jgi:hypothetical protein
VRCLKDWWTSKGSLTASRFVNLAKPYEFAEERDVSYCPYFSVSSCED